MNPRSHGSTFSRRSRRTAILALGLAAVLTAFASGPASAEDEIRVLTEAAEAVAVPAQAAPSVPPGQPAPPAKPPANPATPAASGKPGDAKPDAAPVTVRPQAPDKPADPAELEVRPDADGKVQFNFHGQKWLAVLEWLAKISNQSLDWQELPGDFLNLRTQRRYTVDEARNLINRPLLDRGFTILRNGDILSVVNTKKLDPSLVPRVRPADLETRDPYEYVRVSFPLEWLMAEAAVEEFKPMLSLNGKLTALKSTNRLEAIDAVVNLREIHKLLVDEQSSQGRKKLVQEFRLEHVRAAEVYEQLQILLGLEKPLTPEQRMQKDQMEMQARQQNPNAAAASKPKVQVNLIVNARENSVVAHAPADQMAIIAEAVKLMDVPRDPSQSLLRNAGRMQVHRMSSIDPDAFVKMLTSMGDLDPTTRLEPDRKKSLVIAHASLADHMTIRMLITKLDGSDRKFEVIKLRRLEADYVAGSIEFMMGVGEKKKNNRPSPYEFMFGMRMPEPEDESKKFRVDADVDNNRLLLWANDVELGEIRNLLVKLGEIPGGNGNPATFRVLDSIDPEEADELLRRLQRSWPSISPNRLELGPGAGPREAPKKEPEPAPRTRPTSKPPQEAVTPPRAARTDPRAAERRLGGDPNLDLVAFAQAEETTPGTGEPRDETPPPRRPAARPEVPPDAERTALPEAEDESFPPRRPAERRAAPPIRIGRGHDGRLIVSSDDTEALDQLEDLIAEIAPPRREYKVFKMKYKTTWAWGVAQNLKDFFADPDKDKKNNRPNYNPWWGMMMQNQNDDTGRRLSKRKPLKFIDDTDSNSILVVGADAEQLKIIRDLIDIYDVEEPKDSAAARLTKTYHLKNSKARVVADALKEVYRDLLSVNDPAMQQGKGNDKDRPPERSYTYIYGGAGGDDKKPDSPVKFKGALSIGVDEVSNTLIVSSSAGLLEAVEETIETLDRSARPMVPRMQVLQLNRSMNLDEVQQRLSRMMPKPPPPPRQGQNPQQQQNGQPQQGQQGEATTVIFN